MVEIKKRRLGSVQVQIMSPCSVASIANQNCLTVDALWTLNGADFTTGLTPTNRQLSSPDFDVSCCDTSTRWRLQILLEDGTSDVSIRLIANEQAVKFVDHIANLVSFSIGDELVKFTAQFGCHIRMTRLWLFAARLDKNKQITFKASITVYHSAASEKQEDNLPASIAEQKMEIKKKKKKKPKNSKNCSDAVSEKDVPPSSSSESQLDSTTKNSSVSTTEDALRDVVIQQLENELKQAIRERDQAEISKEAKVEQVEKELCKAKKGTEALQKKLADADQRHNSEKTKLNANHTKEKAVMKELAENQRQKIEELSSRVESLEKRQLKTTQTMNAEIETLHRELAMIENRAHSANQRSIAAESAYLTERCRLVVAQLQQRQTEAHSGVSLAEFTLESLQSRGSNGEALLVWQHNRALWLKILNGIDAQISQAKTEYERLKERIRAGETTLAECPPIVLPPLPPSPPMPGAALLTAAIASASPASTRSGIPPRTRPPSYSSQPSTMVQDNRSSPSQPHEDPGRSSLRNDHECQICLGSCSPSAAKVDLYSCPFVDCAELFHRKCISDWCKKQPNRECPNCRRHWL